MEVLLDGAPTNPASGFANVSGAGAMFLGTGSVSLRAFNIPNGQGWWIDDVSVRRAVNPEPTVTLGAEQPKQ